MIGAKQYDQYICLRIFLLFIISVSVCVCVWKREINVYSSYLSYISYNV